MCTFKRYRDSTHRQRWGTPWIRGPTGYMVPMNEAWFTARNHHRNPFEAGRRRRLLDATAMYLEG